MITKTKEHIGQVSLEIKAELGYKIILSVFNISLSTVKSVMHPAKHGCATKLTGLEKRPLIREAANYSILTLDQLKISTTQVRESVDKPPKI